MQSGFDDSTWRMQCDHKPIVLRKRLDFAKTRNAAEKAEERQNLGAFGGVGGRTIQLSAGSVRHRNPLGIPGKKSFFLVLPISAVQTRYAAAFHKKLRTTPSVTTPWL
jgi:hypothetical protein